MANQSQLNILKQGVETWNQWRKEHPSATIDLRRAKLKGKDLGEANFQNADIRGATFRNAYLVGADFTQTRGGHDFWGSCIQLLFASALGGVTGFLLGSSGIMGITLMQMSLEKHLYSPLITILSIVFIGFSVLLTGGYIFAIGRGKGVVAVAVTVAIAMAMTVARAEAETVAIIVAIIVDMAVAVAVAGVGGTVAVGVGGGIVAVAVAGVVAWTAFKFWALTTVVEIEAVVEFAVIELLIISSYIGWQIRHEDPQFAFLRSTGLTLGSLFSTNFRGANLTGATFSDAHLKYTRFVEATLVGVVWQKANDLQFAYVPGTVLVDPAVRELLVHGSGQDLSLRGKNLHGAYLVGADLRNTDLRETELIQANLSRANITGAHLYGSARENWIIDDIQCDYKRGIPHATFTVFHQEHKEDAQKQLIADYETKIKVLEGREAVLMDVISRFIERPQLQVTIGELTEGDKIIGRDSVEIRDNAHVKQLSTGNSKDESTREE